MDVYSRELKNIAPDRGENLLARSGGWLSLDRNCCCGGGLWKSLAIDLSIGQQWQVLEDHKGRRHHVGGQSVLEKSAQFLGQGGTRAGGDVGHQACDGGFGLCHDDTIADLGMSAQSFFDLSKLDAEASDLYLMIETAEKLDDAIAGEACKIACAVKPGLRVAAEMVWNELGRCEFGGGEVSLTNRGSSDEQLPGHSDGRRLQGFVYDVNLRICNGAADGHGAPGLARAALPEGNVNGGLCWSI